MIISELVRKLEAFRETFGDLSVVVWDLDGIDCEEPRLKLRDGVEQLILEPKP